ncbi:CHASE domain-containing protein [Shewanella sp. YIC-542]|uniref:CHASE domain-containing sensor histidine kinase n=1 Tax=Shewanella mytili TaxID=3377111 RepID=UPI00398F8026
MTFALVFVLVGGYLFNFYIEQRGLERFEFQTRLLKNAISDRMRTYEQVLRGGLGLFRASNGVTREEWHDYVSNARLNEFYPGIQGMGYSQFLSAEQIAGQEAQIQAEGFPEYRVHPEGRRQRYLAIIYLEPFDWRNRRAFGYDMYSEPVRRKAIDRALATGEAAISGKITLVQETGQDQQAGFLMYLPLFAEQANGQRRPQGMVYAPFRMNNLMEGITGDHFSSLQLEIYDGSLNAASNPETLMYRSRPRPPSSYYHHNVRLDIGGHQWLLVTRSNASFVSTTESIQRALLLAFGGLFWLLLFYFLYTNAKARFKETQLSQALLANEERFRLVIEASPTAMVIVNAQGMMTLVNAHTEQMFKYTREEMLGHEINMLLPEVVRRRHSGHMAKYFQHPTARTMSSRDDLYGQCSDGQLIALEVGLTPVMFSNGPAVLVTINDISSRKQIEQEKARHTAELERINSELDSFAYIASHDLKSPLRGIEQLSDWLHEDLAENASPKVQQYLRLIRSRVQRMERLLEGLLTYSRIGRIDAQLVKTDSAQLVQEVFALVNLQPEYQLQIQSALPEFVTARVPLELVFRNLFSNALKHHDRDKGVISVSCCELKAQYCFCVEDDGPGIPAQFHEKVFAIFQTLRPRDEVEGSGLGLSLVKKCVENFGGRIWLESEGRGCRFCFTWPKNLEDNPE